MPQRALLLDVCNIEGLDQEDGQCEELDHDIGVAAEALAVGELPVELSEEDLHHAHFPLVDGDLEGDAHHDEHESDDVFDDVEQVRDRIHSQDLVGDLEHTDARVGSERVLGPEYVLVEGPQSEELQQPHEHCHN